MKRNILIAALAVLMLGACGRIETGHVGKRTEFNGAVETTVLNPGFYWAVFSHVDEFAVQEIEVKFDNLTPKGKDNLILADFDISVWYQVNAADVAKLSIKYVGMTQANEKGLNFPMFNLVSRVAQGGIFDVVSQFDSLTIHTKRTELETGIRDRIQRDLDETDKGEFKVTKVIVRQIKTDPTLEASIQRAVQMQKDTEAKNLELALTQAEAKRKVAEAEGIAAYNQKITASLTDTFIRYQQVLALKEAAKVGTVIVLPTDAKALVNLPVAK